jgi:hypothetical protein
VRALELHLLSVRYGSFALAVGKRCAGWQACQNSDEQRELLKSSEALVTAHVFITSHDLTHGIDTTPVSLSSQLD